MLSSENRAVLIDLNKHFYPNEVKEICHYFKANKNNQKLINKLKGHIYHISFNDNLQTNQNMQTGRTNFIKEFKLENEIDIKP